MRIDRPCARYSTTNMIAEALTTATATPEWPASSAGSMKRVTTEAGDAQSPTTASRPRSRATRPDDQDEGARTGGRGPEPRSTAKNW